MHGGEGGPACESRRKVGEESGRRGSEDEAANPVLQDCDVEVDEEADAAAAQAEVSEKLGVMDGRQPINRLEFEDKGSGNQEVETVSGIEPNALVGERNRDLPLEGEAPQSEFMAEAFLVDRLQESWAESSMDFVGCPDHGVGQRVSWSAHPLV